MKNIYLDNAASTPVKSEVKSKAIDMLDIFGNPSSIHDIGQIASGEISSATETISEVLNCKPSEIYYTSGATMSNNLAIQGFLKANPNGCVIYSAIEHNDIIMLAESSVRNYYKVSVDKEGFVNLDELKKLLEVLSGVPVLVSIQMANSEIGTIQHMDEISELVHSFPMTYLHTDATQYIPYYSMDTSLVDMFSMSGQKIGCIKGTGILYVKNGVPISPIIYGEQGLIGGTENTLGIACLGMAFECLDYYKTQNLISMRDYLINNIDYELIGAKANRLPNNVCLATDMNGEAFVYIMNEQGIYISSGSACSSLSDEPSHVILSLGRGREVADKCIRLTVGHTNTIDEIKYVVNKINMIKRLKK